jgi:acetylornithine deacetylase
MVSDEVEARVLDAVDARALIDSLIGLVRIPTVTASDAESELQHRLATRMTGLGLDVDLWPLDLPALRRHKQYPGTEVGPTKAGGW